MKFAEFVKSTDVIVENGPLGTRLKHDYGFKGTFYFTGQSSEKKALIEIYKGDIEIAQKYKVPLILNAATFRASRNHLLTAGFKIPDDIERINNLSITLIKTLRDSYVGLSAPIFIGAPMGSMYDAYSVDIVPSIEEAVKYHQEQANIIKKIKVDFINAVTFPNLPEAIGLSLAAENVGVDYTIGFVLNKDGKLLDGHCLDEAMQAIDKKTRKKPLGYLVTCTHTSIIEKLAKFPDKYKRLIGIQPNGSNLQPKKLASLNKSISDAPKKFTKNLMGLKTILGLKIIGGCCGTTREHLKKIAEACHGEYHCGNIR